MSMTISIRLQAHRPLISTRILVDVDIWWYWYLLVRTPFVWLKVRIRGRIATCSDTVIISSDWCHQQLCAIPRQNFLRLVNYERILPYCNILWHVHVFMYTYIHLYNVYSYIYILGETSVKYGWYVLTVKSAWTSHFHSSWLMVKFTIEHMSCAQKRMRFWKPQGCHHGAECGRCHLCPATDASRAVGVDQISSHIATPNI